MKRLLRSLLTTALVAFTLLIPVYADPSLPEPKGMLNDFAGKLDSQTGQQIEGLLGRFRDKTQIEIAIAMVNFDDLQGYDPAEYALDLGRKWGVGRDSEKRGLLLLIAIKGKGDDNVFHGDTRLEVSRKLEGDIPDILAGEVIRKMRTDFQAGRFNEAVLAGTQTILATLQQRLGITVDGVDPSQAARRPVRRGQNPRQPGAGGGLIGFILIVIIVGIAVAIIVSISKGGRGGPGIGGGRRGYRGSADWIIWPLILGGWGGNRGGGSGWGGTWGGGGSSWGGGGDSGGGGFGGFGGGGDFGGGGASDSW